MEKRTLGRRIFEARKLYLFALPYMSLFFIFTVIPVVISIAISFTSFNVLSPPKFVGFDNYVRMFVDDEIFLTALKNTFIIAIITGPVGYILSILFAWFVNELRLKLRAIMTLVFYAPAIAGNVYMIWTVLFSGDSYGYINGLLLKFGLISAPIQWLTDARYMMGVLISVMLWTSLGAGFLSFIAGFQGVDRSLYEAGAIDGISNRWQELWFITLPSMRPQMMFGAVMSITSSFSVGTVTTSLFGMPSRDYVVHTLMNHLEDYGGVRFEMGYACALATLLFLIMLLSNLLVKRILSKVGQ